MPSGRQARHLARRWRRRAGGNQRTAFR